MRPKIPSQRIRCIVDKLRHTDPVYDLCCDHGLIGLLAWERNSQRAVSFVDQSPNALIALQKELEKPRYRDAAIQVHTCPAEELVLTSPSNLVIAGVGNSTIIRILDALLPDELGPHRLILCSQQLTGPLRSYLAHRDWPILEETSVLERGRRREILLIDTLLT